MFSFSNIVRTLSILVLLAMAGCAKSSSSTGPDNSGSDVAHLAQGWRDFEGQQYEAAATEFSGALSNASTSSVRGEALTGRGWTSMYKRNLGSSKADLISAAGTSGIASSVLADARVGAAFVLYALNDFSSAAAYADTALTSNPSYLFSHDSKVTAKRVRLLLVQSYYANGQFTQAAAQLDVFDPAHAPHSSDPSALLGSINSALSTL